MRIAIDIRSLQQGTISGVESYTLNLIDHLIKLDHENEYIFFYNSPKQLDFSHFQYINSRIINFGWPNKILNLSLIATNQPDLQKFLGKVDLLFMPNLNYVSKLEATKLVLTVHDLSIVANPSYFSLKMNLWHRAVGMKNLIKRADKVIAVSEYTKQDLIRLYGIPEEKIEVIYHAPSLSATLPLEKSRLRRVRNLYELPYKYYLTLSTLEPRKNLLSVIEAFELINDSSELIIAGRGGWKYKQLYKRARNSKKRNRIRFLGKVSEHDKPYLIKQSRALVYPSFYEGFGLVPLEAISLGVPVVTSGVTSLPEVLGDAALLVNPYNTNDLAFAMEAVDRDEKVRTMLIERGLARAKKFSWNTAAQKLLNTFNQL